MKHHQQLHKYLRNRAVTASWQLAGDRRQDYRAAIVIPALAEFQSLPYTLASLAANPADHLAQTLIIVVVNHRVNASDHQREDNRATLKWLATGPFPELQLAYIDAASEGLALSAKEGVGLARKIGFDAVLTHVNWQQNPLLISLDADTLVDTHYLPAIFTHFDQPFAGGAVIPFRHQQADSPAQEAAIRDYELYLRSYRFGLQFAGSPYSYHSIGSAFACTARAYLAAGGMNRRLAAEDFYFLQQLQKTSGVTPLAGTVVQPAARFSERVPFGTGQVIKAQVAGHESRYQWIGSEAFCVLKQWLEALTMHSEASADDLSIMAADISPQLAQFLDECDFAQNYQRICVNHPPGVRRLAAFHVWFDALRTRQLLTRFAASSETLETSVTRLLAVGGYDGVAEKKQQLQLLEKLQGVDEDFSGRSCSRG